MVSMKLTFEEKAVEVLKNTKTCVGVFQQDRKSVSLFDKVTNSRLDSV